MEKSYGKVEKRKPDSACPTGSGVPLFGAGRSSMWFPAQTTHSHFLQTFQVKRLRCPGYTVTFRQKHVETAALRYGARNKLHFAPRGPTTFVPFCNYDP